MQIIQFHNPGVITDQLPENIFLKLKETLKERRASNEALNTTAKRGLQISSLKEVDYVPYVKELDDYLKYVYIKWCESFNTLPQKIKIDPVWVNYMQSTEFSPMHMHNALLSFVIWVQIPYNSHEEDIYHDDHINSQISLSEKCANGKFHFMYQTYTGDINFHIIPLSKEYEGRIVMFPSKMYHTVYPFFSSNVERISVAGNLILDF